MGITGDPPVSVKDRTTLPLRLATSRGDASLCPMNRPVSCLIVGCGYVGLRLGARWAQAGYEVTGVRRGSGDDDFLRELGIQPLTADITSRVDLERLGGPYDYVVNLVSSSKGGAEAYRAVHLNGQANLLDWMQKFPPKKYVFTSSTSVYGQTDGSMVDETSPAEPSSETSAILRQAEDFLLDAAREGRVPAVVLRLSGIYGPGRGHLFHAFVEGRARSHGDGSRYLNMIHLEDTCTAIEAACQIGQPGEIYNISDDAPPTEREFYQWLADRLGKDFPPPADPESLRGRKRGNTHKAILNRKAREQLQWVPQFPDFRAGYEPEIQALATGSAKE